MNREVILEALRRAGATFEGESVTTGGEITKQDMMLVGLSGGKDSSAKRIRLMKLLNLPERLSANAFLQALNLLCTREEFFSLTEKLEQNDG